MKKLSWDSSRFVLTAGALASLTMLPQRASAQIVGGYARPGAIVQGQPVRPAAPVRMMPGPIVRGAFPVYRPAPVYTNPVYGGGQTVGHGPVMLQPIYGRGGTVYYGNGYNGNGYNTGSGYYSNGSGYNGSGPVVTLPEPVYSPNRGGRNGDGSYGGGAYLPPVGAGNGFFHNPIPPVGPANGYLSGQAPITGGGPALLGGYYYGNYCNTYAPNSYPSVYSDYSGFPQYVYSSNIVVADPQPVDYSTPSLPFYTPVYQTTYNQNNYYVATPERVAQLQEGGDQAKAALEHAYPADSFQAAFADIAHAWTDGSIDLIKKHLRDPDTRISVFLDGKYSYSIASSDFSQITRDALDRLHTASFDFTRLRKAKNGDVTAFGAHVYRAIDPTDSGSDTGTVPFDQSGTDPNADGTTLGPDKTIYVSYTLRRYGTEWDIVATDSASHDLAAAASK